MTEPKWLSVIAVKAIHERLLAAHGGLSGVRDEGLLESALARPRQQFAYAEPSLFSMAAAYAFGIARNHPFADGNKRTALMAAYIFLRLNGYRLIVAETEAVDVIRNLAAGDIEETDLAGWLEANVAPL